MQSAIQIALKAKNVIFLNLNWCKLFAGSVMSSCGDGVGMGTNHAGDGAGVRKT